MTLVLFAGWFQAGVYRWRREPCCKKGIFLFKQVIKWENERLTFLVNEYFLWGVFCIVFARFAWIEFSCDLATTVQTWEAKWTVQKFEYLPEWLQDNEFLRHGHRPPLPSFAECFRSILALHTETGNIWTHLIGLVFNLYLFLEKSIYFLETFFLVIFSICLTFAFTGCVAFALLATWFLTRPDTHIKFQEKLVFSFFFAGAILCLGMSFTFHTVSCHSIGVVRLFCK